MTLNQLDEYLNSLLQKEAFSTDPSKNGIQIQNSEPDKKEIKKIAYAVDACEETALKAVEAGADVLVVHHGILWGQCSRITDSFYKRISTFIKNDLALIAYHLPLDANNLVGNNYGMAFRLGMKNLEPFGKWHGMTLGVKGELPVELTIEELGNKVLREGKNPDIVLKFGKEKIKTVGIISGGAGDDVNQAIEEGLDAFITGNFPHEQYHYAKEMGINVIGGGHYETEVFGVNLLEKKIKEEKGVPGIFIDIPTLL